MRNRRFVLCITALLVVASAITQAEKKSTSIIQQLEKTPASVMYVGRLRLDLYLSQSIQDIKASWPVKNVELYEAKSFIKDNKELYLVARGKAAARFLDLEHCATALETFDGKLDTDEKLRLTWEGMVSDRDIEKLTKNTYLMLIVEESTNPNLQVKCILKVGTGDAIEYK